jgi:isopenicillin-N epimerase
MWTRRDFLQAIVAATAAVAHLSAEEAAQDEAYWRTIQRAFEIDRSFINLNNGNSSPSPRIVHEAMKGYLDYSNRLPVYYRGLLEQKFDGIRKQAAAEFGCDPEELAFTRNATESLHIAQGGIDLQPGDEVLTTDQDYTLMLWAWEQRALREKIRITRVQFPVPATSDELIRRFEQAITPRTKVLHFCHITNVTGQLFPVRELSRMARRRGIVTIVDGAQAAAHVPLKLRDLECDVYGTSLHKWLMAPHGTGFLYVRREMIPGIWPLHAEVNDMRADIRKFEEAGTQTAAARSAIGDALLFHGAIGADRKAARHRYLTLRWANALKGERGVRMLSSLEPGQTWGLATLGFDRNVDVQALSRLLLSKYRIVTSDVVSQRLPGPVFDFQGLRVTPNVYTTVEEIDRFVAAMKDVIATSLPARKAAASSENPPRF